ncbi:MAG: hypothetical protein MJZ88_04525 [Paludibacteraceae bacterium]|nr:hypothetical protein [Paludibacteraceae bacterium]
MLQHLEQNIHLLLTRLGEQQDEITSLKDQLAQQRQEVMLTHSELLQLKERYRALQIAHTLSAAPDDKVRARRQVDALIAQVDRAIEILKRT